ncbi:MAG: hypothetical protein HC826_02320, partial [Rhodospirillales bacterium]|nr:hypothetical protein [Rhodospirillales bacterium]
MTILIAGERQMQIVKDLMVPLNDYPRIPDGASLHDAIKALEMALLCIPLASVFTILPGGMPIMIELCKRAFAIFASTATVATLIGVVFGVVEAAARHGNA